jgi:hypothetical protein
MPDRLVSPINSAATPPPAIPDARFLFHENRHYPQPPQATAAAQGGGFATATFDIQEGSPRLGVICEDEESVEFWKGGTAGGAERLTVQVMSERKGMCKSERKSKSSAKPRESVRVRL